LAQKAFSSLDEVKIEPL